jgi:hypothetical protein
VYSKIRLRERLNVRFAPKAAELLRGSEMTRRATSVRASGDDRTI